MNKEDYIKELENKAISNKGKQILIKQINNYYDAKSQSIVLGSRFNLGDRVLLKKGTLLHGTYKNFDGLKEIVKNGLISSWFIDGRMSKYPSSVGLWNLKKDYYLDEYINFYSGGTIKYSGLLENGNYSQNIKTSIIPYDKMKNINEILINNQCRIWNMEQTKEARFMPSLIQNIVQIGIIFDGNNEYIKELVKGDILNPSFINDNDVKEFVNKDYADRFIIDRKNKDDFFTDRESAILFGIPKESIEGILVGRKYENDSEILKEIKELLPNCYICNLDGKVIVE